MFKTKEIDGVIVFYIETPCSETVCPHCKGGKLRLYGSRILHCSLCGSIYQKSSSDALIRLNVNPASNLSEYPEVILYFDFRYCDCSVQAYIETGMLNGGVFGSRYCPKHNVIIIEGFWEPDELASIAQITIEIINHETLHWILCRDFDESTSLWFDEVKEVPL